MTTKKQIEIAKAIVATGLVTKVYHTCQLLKDEQQTKLYPAYQRGAEFMYVGPDDTQGLFAYIRANGDASAVPLRVKSCTRDYEVTAPLRVVFFHDDEVRDHEFLKTRLASFTFLQNVTLLRVIDDKFRLVREESDLYRQHFDAKTFYVAFDISVNLLLLQSECETETPCEVFPNPIC